MISLLTPIVIALIVCVTVLCLAWRAETYLRLKLHEENVLDDRQFQIAKRRQELLEQHAFTEKQAADLRRGEIQLPNDLDALAAQESEAWAIDETRQAMKEKFLELHNGDSDDTWQRVRRAWGIGEMPS